LDIHWPYWFHPPNGGTRDIVTAKRLQALGVKRGVPDIIVLCRYIMDGKMYHGIVIEMKSDGRAKATVYQRWWLSVFKQLGWYTMVAHGADEAIAYLEKAIPSFVQIKQP
jgi:hypothetical protein